MKKGFTIIELVIVISVLIILIGIAIPHMKGMQQSGNIVKAKGELQTLQAAMESYYNNITPHTYIPTTTTPCVSFFNTASPQIVTSTLYDPFNGNGGSTEYQAIVSTNGSFYAFGSVGAQGAGLGTFTISSSGAVTTTTGGGGICVTNGVSGC
jgi:prepilin-type N-terminal cleavage/methylation domain-containing protein